MIFEILTLFPEIFASFLSQSLLAKALAAGILTVSVTDIRDFAADRHRTADDRPFGGGPGMVLKAEPVALAVESRLGLPGPPPLVVGLTPSGELLNQALVRELAKEKRIMLICGRYEGVDQRVLDLHVQKEISVGDYVVNGGEVPAMVLVEAVSRLVPGFLGKDESLLDESHSYGLLEAPLYTRPSVWRGVPVPRVLLSGHRAQIAAYNLAESVDKTRRIRPELLERPGLMDEVAAAFDRAGSPLGGGKSPNAKKKEGRGRKGADFPPRADDAEKAAPSDEDGPGAGHDGGDGRE
ncbi:MAG: tRNA (guanosine(37)-N1)-methyltransferase TrmD [Deltaproteobacteria bacterium]|jgi:tRNA (guanine37-N1)-methyltransferase|nr:tRNA (guanosine(37)-N1)-methyltransferase TrmD [Deltaproteobacteria bacterium]